MKASSEYYKIFVDLTDTTSSHPEHNYLFNRHEWSSCIINETFIYYQKTNYKVGLQSGEFEKLMCYEIIRTMARRCCLMTYFAFVSIQSLLVLSEG